MGKLPYVYGLLIINESIHYSSYYIQINVIHI